MDDVCCSAMTYAIQIASISGRHFQPGEVIELARTVESYLRSGVNVAVADKPNEPDAA